MENVDGSSVRYTVLQSAKLFKTSWIELGQALFSVWKDKLYREWGYSTFDAYTLKEIGIRKQTALKLLRSYYFLEKEEPQYLSRDYNEKAEPKTLPTYEAVNELRLANKKKEINAQEYESFKKKALESGKDAREIKKDLTTLIKERRELEPEEAWKNKKMAIIRRLLSSLKSVQREIKISKMLTPKIAEQIGNVIRSVENELPR